MEVEKVILMEFIDFFPGKLRFWSVHCVINAVPSYLIAVVWMQLWGSKPAQVAMLAAVVTFIFGYAALTSSLRVFQIKGNLFNRALRVGLILRTVISVITVIAVPLGPFLMFTTDLWCGHFANNAVADVLGVDGLMGKGGVASIRSMSKVSFLEIYLTTILEGLILSFMLFIFSFIAIIFLQRKSKTNFYSEKNLRG